MESPDEKIIPDLNALFELLHREYGPQRWWPGDTPFEVIVGAILTQNTAWKNVERAISNLKERGLLTPGRMAAASEQELAALIRPSGYFNQKARKLLSFLRFFGERYGYSLELMAASPLEALRGELLSLFGIGEETADSILLYALEMPTFVIDAYTRRIFYRVGYAEQNVKYSELKRRIEAELPRNTLLYNEFHALLVRHGKYVCRPEPHCRMCVVRNMCLFLQSRTG